jgi:hypothetical protein
MLAPRCNEEAESIPMDSFRPTAQLKLSITSRCNNACDICFRKNQQSRLPAATLGMDTLRDLLSQGAAMGFLGAYWTGGEPLLEYGNLLELIAFASSKGMVSSLATNAGPLGAFGDYKAMNRELFASAGTYPLSCDEMVGALARAGLVRVFLSLDDSHNSLSEVEPTVAHKVPTAVAAEAIAACLRAGFGHPHATQAIGHRLRVSATAGGRRKIPTRAVVEDTMRRAQLQPSGSRWYSRADGRVLVKLRETSAIGAARALAPSCVDRKGRDELFAIRCQNFRQAKDAYDGGRYHRDLHVDHTGTVYLCGAGMFPLGSVYQSSLQQIVSAVATGRGQGAFEQSVAVFHRLFKLSTINDVGNRAVGEALRLVHLEEPSLLRHVACEGSACTALGTDAVVQSAFIRAFDRAHG